MSEPGANEIQNNNQNQSNIINFNNLVQTENNNSITTPINQSNSNPINNTNEPNEITINIEQENQNNNQDQSNIINFNI